MDTTAQVSPGDNASYHVFSSSRQKLRRNGRPMSCEPCRIAKIKCDHGSPCQKCKSRNLVSKCYYHAAPMTRPSSARRRTSAVSALSATERNSPSVLSPRSTESVRSLRENFINGRNHAIRLRPGYMGFTNFTSAFSENVVPQEDRDVSPPIDAAQPTGLEWRLRTQQMEKQRLALECFRRFSLVRALVEDYYPASNFTIIPNSVFKHAMLVVQGQVEAALATNDDLIIDDFLSTITGNTTKPFKVPPDMRAVDFPTLFTGANIRWEFIGILFAVAGLAAVFRPRDTLIRIGQAHAGEESPFTSKELVTMMALSSKTCVDICQEVNALNLMMVWLEFADGVLQSNYSGDTSPVIWRTVGDMASDVFALGLHQQHAGSTEQAPFFFVEAKRRLFASVYRSDKSISTLFGRPPRISVRYCNFTLPLDLEDEDLVLEGPELDAKLANLTEDGWNTLGQAGDHARPAALVRLRYHISVMREEILEYSIGRKEVNFEEKLNAMYERFVTSWRTFPDWLKHDVCPVAYQSEEPRFASDTDEKLLMDSLGTPLRIIKLAYLEYLQALFHVQRLLSREAKVNSPELLEISNRALTTVVAFVQQRVAVSDIYLRQNTAWILMFHGLPPAGVLATELRLCVQTGKPLPPRLSRSHIIRTLSILVPWFDWVVSPDDWNYSFCRGIVKMLSRTLDDILNHEPSVGLVSPANSSLQPEANEAPAQSSLENRPDPFFDNFGAFEPIPLESGEFLGWLDSVDWESGLCLP